MRFADATAEVGGLDRTPTMGGSGVERRFVDEAVAEVAVTASDLVAGRGPAKLIRRFVMLPHRRDHDVSILITIGDAAGRQRGEPPRSKVSMTIMRPPQHGQGRGSTHG